MSKRQIPAKKVVADIKGGMSDETLREKYRLSPKGLESLFKKLLAQNLITQPELDDRHAGKEPVGSEEQHEIEQPGEGPSDDNEVRADVQGAPQDESHGAQDSLSDSALLAFDEGREGEYERNPRQHWLAVILVLAFLVAAGLCFFWMSPLEDNIGPSLWRQLTRLTNGQSRTSHETAPLAVQQGKEVPGNKKGLSDCEEKEPLFPVSPVQDNDSAKEVLTTILRLRVFMRDSGARAYYSALRELTRTEPPEQKMLFRDFFVQEYGCRIDPDDMEMMRHLANDLVEDKISRAFGSSVGTQPVASAGADATDKEVEEELDRKMRWLNGEPFLERLKLVKKDTIRCNRALKETIAFLGVTVDKAVDDCREYEKELAERATRIRQCRQRIKSGRTEGTKDSGVSAKR